MSAGGFPPELPKGSDVHMLSTSEWTYPSPAPIPTTPSVSSGLVNSSGIWSTTIPYTVPSPEAWSPDMKKSVEEKDDEDLTELVRKMREKLDVGKDAEKNPEPTGTSKLSLFKQEIESEEFGETLAILAQRLAQYRDFLTDNGFSSDDSLKLVSDLFDKMFLEVGSRG